VTSIVVSHDRDLSLTIADRVALMQNGQIHSIAPPAEYRQATDPLITEFLNPQINLQNPRFKTLEATS
ncbi:MAG: ABC transporter ATP-binding protein, partial [Verrucomicrobiia bacterium]